jgi:LPS-assembly lipoprotein
MKQLILAPVVVLALLMAGCSYRPLYGKSSANSSTAIELSDVAVEEQATRAGQLLRNELISAMGPSGSGRYILRLEIVEKTQFVSSVAKSVVDRNRYRLNVTYHLVAPGSGKELTSGKSFSNVSYDTVREPVADLQAAENARERAARELAQDLRLRLSAYFAGQNS